jgi:2-iminobutanoate/2-iminopropanoate deaminase
MRQHLSPAEIRPPFGRYHHLVAVEGATRLAFLSGQLGIRPDSSIPETVEEQAEVAFANIDACLAAAGLGRRHVTRLTTYLTDAEYRRAYMQIRDAWVADPPPASTLLVVKALALPAFRIEIEAIAAG